MSDTRQKRKIEVMAPAGSFASLTAAIKAGADSVYFGIEQLNMRARAANNFATDDLPKIVEQCNAANVKTYLTVNTVLYDHDTNLMKKICDTAKAAGVTAIIASDLSAITYCKEIGMECHISTQVNVSNFDAVKFFAQYADTVVLARELTLKQIKSIHEKIIEHDIRGPRGELVNIEMFAHGALCVAISGKCHMSLATNNASANRGACVQNCRRAYRVIDEETGDELVIDNKYVMSPKDLCTIGIIDKLYDAGVTVFKLEGRGRSADYVTTVVKTYKEALASVMDGTYTQEKVESWTKDLDQVYNRGFWQGGYYLGKKMDEWAGTAGSQATKERIFLGKATTYFKQPEVGEFKIETGELAKGDTVVIIGPTTGSLRVEIDSLRVDGHDSEKAQKGDVITFPVPERIRENDKLFLFTDRKTLQ